MNPLQRYQSDLDAGLITADPAQLEIVKQLQLLFARLRPPHALPRSIWGRLADRFYRRPSQKSAVAKGIYLWGGVGRGKTYLMDILCDCLSPEIRLRTHFHRFMQDVHTELRKLQGQSNPLEQVAENLSARYRVVCFDEFFVLDIADAMILAGLLEALFRRGVILVTTSNIAPADLYENGLQRAQFLPAIALLKEHTQVLQIAAGDDYRLRTLSKATLYYYPCDASNETQLVASFRRLAPDQTTVRENHVIEILNRKLRTRLCGDDVVWFEFSELCDGPRSAYDYVEITKLFHALFLSAVPQLSDQQSEQVRRFIMLVDVLYDRRVKLIIAAAVPLPDLYKGALLAFEFERTRSRLIEMQSYEYLGYEHRA